MKIVHSRRWHMITFYLLLYDIIAVNAAYFFALWIRFDCRYTMIPSVFYQNYLHFAPFYTILCVIIFWKLKMYHSLWRYASYREMEQVLIATMISGGLHMVLMASIFGVMPATYYFLGILIQFGLTMGVRVVYRFYVMTRDRITADQGIVGRVMLIGGGAAGRMILREVNSSSESRDRVVCVIDDDPNKTGRYIEGIPIIGTREDILKGVEKYGVNRIYMAMPSASAETRRDILNICKETGCELRNLPGIYQLVNGEVSINAMKRVSVEDLLGRPPIKVDMGDIFEQLQDQVILVTGGGGSIGSELCRQIAGHRPKQLIIFDVYENNAYEIQQELLNKYPGLNLCVLIGSVRDSRRVNQVFEKYHPDYVYHAAAHKHVPLMEDSPCEAIKNNAVGTYKTAYAAMRNGCKRFVLISTDKAVNPTNVMGASKRLCEMVIQAFDRMIKAGKADQIPALFAHTVDTKEKIEKKEITTEFVAVRFGNVLGSNGSVIPLFKKQIESGGPVTVTHPDIIRYFMTIPEAVSLVLQAGTYAGGGEIFVLDMGSPVKIDTLARNLIKLSGFRPDVDIRIEYTGLRPGEKLYEEKLMEEEGLKKTDNELIHVGSPISFDEVSFLRQFEKLMRASYDNSDKIKELVQSIVVTYHPAGKHGSEKKTNKYWAEMKEVAATEEEESWESRFL